MILMGLFIRQDDNRSQLQERLASELQERAKQKNQLTDSPDGVDDSQYINQTKQTTRHAWVWVLLSVVVIGGLVWLTISSQIG